MSTAPRRTKLKWDGTFADYLEIRRENPRIATSRTPVCTTW
jgi:hypothetical protein